MRYILLLVAVLIVISCKREEKSEVTTPVHQDTLLSGLKKSLTSFPTPDQILTVLASTGGNYIPDILSDPSEHTKFITRYEKALAIGIYAADMSYVLLHKEIEKSLSYFSSIQKLFEELNMGQILSKDMAEKIKATADNPDSLEALMTQSINIINALLYENKQQDIAIAVLVGSIIEGMHIGLSILDKEQPQNDLLALIVNNREIVSLLLDEEYKNILPSEIQPYLKELNNVLARFKIEEKATASTKGKNLVIGGTLNVEYSKEDINALINTVSNIRKNILK